MTPAADSASEVSNPAPEEKVRPGSFVLEHNGPEPDSWKRWILAEGETASPIHTGQYPSKNCRRILALPTGSLFIWPLWIAAEGESSELIRLELAGRHLLRRGMEESLQIRSVTKVGERRLVVALACEEPFPEEGLPEDWKKADLFEIRPNLLNAPEADLVIWRERGLFYASFQRDGTTVWFCQLRGDLSAELLHRASLRLMSEGILQNPVRIIRLPTEVPAAFIGVLASRFPHAEITSEKSCLPAPPSPTSSIDLAPSAAIEERRKRRRWKFILQVAMGTALLYSLLLLWMGGDYLIHRHAMETWKKKVSALELPAHDAQNKSLRWKTLRPAVDPATYPLDLLSAVAAPTEGGKVRLISFAMEKGHIQVSGEATDVTTAYSFIDQLKKSQALSAYEWNAGQPQLAGKNSVKFDMEGVLSDAAK